MHALLSHRATSASSSAIRDLLKLTERAGVLSLAGGLPAADSFPMDELRAAAERVLSGGGVYGPQAFQYGRTEGVSELRELLGRRIGVDPERVLVTTGSQQALELISRCVVDPGDVVAVEAPSYVGAIQAMRTWAPEFAGIPGDEHGLDVDELAARLHAGLRPKLVYVVANFANPTGATLSMDRRRRLLELATEFGFLIVEDDPYGELRFKGEQLASIGSLPGAEEHVATVRSFSKVVAPGLRVGWSVLPAWLVDAVVVAKQGADLHTSTLSQHLVLELIGDEEAHRVRVAHVAAAYAAKAEALHTALMRHLGDALTVGAVDGGMFLWGAFADESVDTTMLLERALEHDVAFVPGAAFYAGLPAGDVPRHRIRMSFATLPVERFDEAARRLATAVHSQRAGS